MFDEDKKEDKKRRATIMYQMKKLGDSGKSFVIPKTIIKEMSLP